MAILPSVLFTLQSKVDGTLESRRNGDAARELAASPFPAWYHPPAGCFWRAALGMEKRIPRSGGHRQYELRACFRPLVSPDLDVIRCST